MEKIKKYPAGTKGRDIIDGEVESRRYIMPELYGQVQGNPGFYGQVNIGCDSMHLNTIRNKKELDNHLLIDDIISTAENLKLRDGLTPSVRILTDHVSVLETSKEVIAFIKACIAGSYTSSSEFSLAVSAFVKELLPTVNQLCLPIQVQTSSKIEEVVVTELNEYLRKICDESGTKYTEVIVSQNKSPKSVRGMLESAEGK